MEQLRKKYEKEVDIMEKKPRFGYFSILPSHTAAKTDDPTRKCYKSTDGKVITQQRNILAGPPSSGILKKSYFSIPKSIYQGDPYDKHQQENKKIKNTENAKKNDKQIFIPAIFNKTLSTATYKYYCENPLPKNPKIHRKQDGAVKTQQPNICSNPLSKIVQERIKNYKYMGSPYDNQKTMRNAELAKSIKMRKGEGPFRTNSPSREYFTTNFNTYNDHEIKRHERSLTLGTKRCQTVTHQDAFRPSCRPMTGVFSYPRYVLEKEEKKMKKVTINKAETFRPVGKVYSSKPCPSIAYSMMNTIVKIR